MVDPFQVSAGDDQYALGEQTVTLRGVLTDPAGGGTVAWTQVSGPTVALSDATALEPTFTTPVGMAQQTAVFRITATPASGDPVTDDVTVTILPGRGRIYELLTGPHTVDSSVFTARGLWDGDILIDPSLVAGGVQFYLVELNFFTVPDTTTGAGTSPTIRIVTSPLFQGGGGGLGPDFAPGVETNPNAFTLFSPGKGQIVIPGPASTGATTPDATEPYNYTPNNLTAIRLWQVALEADDRVYLAIANATPPVRLQTNFVLGAGVGEARLDSFTPEAVALQTRFVLGAGVGEARLGSIGLDSFNRTRLEVHALALIRRLQYAANQGRTVLYATAARGGTSVPTAGNLNLGPDNIPVSRIMFTDSEITLNDNDNAAGDSLNLATFFGPNGDGNGYSFWVQNALGERASIEVATSYLRGGGNFAVLSNNAAVRTILNGTGVGSYLLVGFTSPREGVALETRFVLGAGVGEASLDVTTPDPVALETHFELGAGVGEASLTVAPPVELQTRFVLGAGVGEARLRVAAPGAISLQTQFQLGAGVGEASLRVTPPTPVQLETNFVLGAGVGEASLRVTPPASVELQTNFVLGAGVGEARLRVTPPTTIALQTNFVLGAGVGEASLLVSPRVALETRFQLGAGVGEASLTVTEAVITRRIVTLFRSSARQPPTPAGESPPAWGTAQVSPSRTQSVWRSTGTLVFGNGVFLSATWTTPVEITPRVRISTSLVQSAFASQTQVPWLILLTISHEEMLDDVRIVNNTEEIISRGQTFVRYPFDIELPIEAHDKPPLARIRIGNVDRRITQEIRTISSAPRITMEIVHSDAPDDVEVSHQGFRLRDCTWDAFTIEGRLVLDAIAVEQYPAGTFSPASFPGLQ